MKERGNVQSHSTIVPITLFTTKFCNTRASNTINPQYSADYAEPVVRYQFQEHI